MGATKERVLFRVTGRVQGVCFRAYTRDAALSFGVTGWVQNAPDGSVEGEAFGNPAALERFTEWLHEGSPHGRVDGVELKDRGPAEAVPPEFAVRF